MLQTRQEDGSYLDTAGRAGVAATGWSWSAQFGDLDNDGDLDIVVNNYRAPSLLFENRLCGGASVQVDLVWSGTDNRFAIGASLRLDTDAGRYRRDVEVTSGYLSSNPPRVHFGLPAGERPQRLTICWPDGAEDVVGATDGLTADTLLTVTR